MYDQLQIQNGIKFNSMFVPAIKNGTKTQTRRLDTFYNIGDVFDIVETFIGPDGNPIEFHSGIRVKVTNVRFQRVRMIRDEDLIAEGMKGDTLEKRYHEFKTLWNMIYGEPKTNEMGEVIRMAQPFQENPFATVIEFERFL